MRSTSNNKTNKAKGKAVLASAGQNFKSLLAKSPVTSAVAIAVLSCIFINLLAGLLAYQTYVVGERQKQLETFAEHNARVAASNIANYMHDSYKKLEFFKNSSSLVGSLRYKDVAGILEIQNALKNSFPKAVAIRIFATGHAKVNLEGDPPLRFAEVEIIRHAEARERVVHEAISVEGSD